MRTDYVIKMYQKISNIETNDDMMEVIDELLDRYGDLPKETENLINNILTLAPSGSTNIYDTSIRALEILNNVDLSIYNTSIILMTDGMSNSGNYTSLVRKYDDINKDIPIYSIMFGSAYEDELESIANLTNAKVFDGKSDLLKAFKEVRGYN